MPKVISLTKTYEDLLKTISLKNLKIKNAKAGISIFSDNNLKIDIIAPNNDFYSELNNYSVVIKITYKNRKFLFMGDAEAESENEIDYDLKADVIKIGHHGSSTSTCPSLLLSAKPKYAVISVGKNNSLGHPDKGVLDSLSSAEVTVYRTDIHGDITAFSDGTNITFKTQKNG